MHAASTLPVNHSGYRISDDYAFPFSAAIDVAETGRDSPVFSRIAPCHLLDALVDLFIGKLTAVLARLHLHAEPLGDVVRDILHDLSAFFDRQRAATSMLFLPNVETVGIKPALLALETEMH